MNCLHEVQQVATLASGEVAPNAALRAVQMDAQALPGFALHRAAPPFCPLATALGEQVMT